MNVLALKHQKYKKKTAIKTLFFQFIKVMMFNIVLKSI